MGNTKDEKRFVVLVTTNWCFGRTVYNPEINFI